MGYTRDSTYLRLRENKNGATYGFSVSQPGSGAPGWYREYAVEEPNGTVHTFRSELQTGQTARAETDGDDLRYFLSSIKDVYGNELRIGYWGEVGGMLIPIPRPEVATQWQIAEHPTGEDIARRTQTINLENQDFIYNGTSNEQRLGEERQGHDLRQYDRDVRLHDVVGEGLETVRLRQRREL